MAVSLGFFLFAYICLVFQITHRICMMQCNPMPGPGMYHGDMGDIRFSGSHVENTGSVRERRDGLNTRQIRFDPSYLDFQEQPVGMPRIKTVAIINPSRDQSLQLQSISGSTVHFHASFFQAKIVQPLGNTTFEIVFLARLVGNAENTLFIHTSKGVYPYQVFGTGSPNPYRLRPFLGAKVPLNYSFTSLINMHNPYSSPLQVIEMYSSGGDLHLELPSGLEKAPQKHWEIQPYETKALMRVSFVGRFANNHTAFIRIKTSNPSPVTEFLILPVEVEVTSVPGLFASVDLLDFGTLRTMDEPKAVGVYILNSGSKQAHISSVTVEPSNNAVLVTFNPVILKPGSKYVKIATVTFSGYHVKRSKQMTGKIVIKTNKSINRLELPYQANVLQGTIAYSVSKTRFFVGQSPFVPVVRELPITNTFSFTMVIYEATFPHEVENLFKVVNFTKPAMIPSQKTASPFQVQFLANSSDLSFSTILRVYTNASIFTIPIHCYNGKLKYVVEGLEEDVVDYGNVGTNEIRRKIMRIYNENPVEVTISKITCTVEYASVKLLDVHPKASKNNSASKSQTLTKDIISVKPEHLAVFLVEITVPGKPGRHSGEFEITTDFEVLHIPIYFKAIDGKVFPSPKLVTFQPCFPGRIERSSLALTSTFLHPLRLLTVIPEPPDIQFLFELNKTEPVESNDIIGNVIFDPLQVCKDQCYVGLGISNSAMATKWLTTLTLPHDVVDIDNQYIEKLQRAYDSLKRNGKNRINTTLLIDTDLAQGIRVTAQATLTWPSLGPEKPIKFPLTQIGNYSIKYFSLENPADVPVVVQIVSLAKYPKPLRLLDLIADRFGADVFDLDEVDNVFSLPNVDSGKSDNSNTSLPGVSPVIQGVLGIAPAPTTYVTILQPRSKIHLPLQFLPVDDKMHSSIILIRNNLTVLDAVTVQGQGAKGEFMLNSKQPGVHSTLLFELRASHLSDCHKPSSRSRTQPPLSVKKVLTATNPGQLAIFVRSLSINGHECEGYGFKILNCKSFILNPNSSRKIEIAFTPDFTMSRVTRRLEVETTFGLIMEFTLVATIPPHILPLCAAAMGHSSWEPVFQVFTVVVMVIMFVGVVIAAYSEARTILGISLPTANLLLNCEERGPVFDLKAIAGVKPKLTKDERQLNIRKSRRDLKDSKPNDRQQGDSAASTAASTAAAVAVATGSTNNNVNKNSPITKQDKNKSPKTNENRLNKTPTSDSKSFPPSHEPRIRHEKPLRSNIESITKKDYKPAVAEIEELKQSIANVQEMESENSMNFVKDFKDVKSKSKKKSKALNKRDESKSKTKDRNSTRRQTDCSDDSGNEGDVERISLGIRLDIPTNKHRPDSVNKGTNEKTKARKNQVSPSNESKGKRIDNQTGKPNSLDFTTKNKDRIAALQAESRDLGPNSPHAIAAAVMSHLEKSLQTTTRDNSYEEGEVKRKAFNKASNRLSDSPPLVSPTNLSGSSRSSSYSSIVSSDGSSSGSDQGKGSLTKVFKQRLKSSRSMPLGDKAAIGFRPMKHSSYHPFSLSSVKTSPWSTSADSALAPGSRSPTIHRPSTSPLSSIPSTSLFESTPFNTLAGKSDDPRSSQKADCPLDLSAFGVSGDGRRSHPSIWSSTSNPDSLFSVPPPSAQNDDKQVPRANNWVNFLDNANTSPTAVNFNKSVSEIWDAGSVSTTDGWSRCSPQFPGENKDGEPDPVDALFSASPDWSGVDTQENAPFVAQETWGPAPVSNIWGDQYPIPTSRDTGLESPEPESPGGSFDAMSGYNAAEIWQQPWSSSKK